MTTTPMVAATRRAALLPWASLAVLAGSPLLAQATPQPTPAAAPLTEALRERAEWPRRMLLDALPAELQESQALGLYPWQWILLVTLPLLAWILAWLIEASSRPLLRRLAARTPTVIDNAVVVALAAPARLALFVLFLALGLPIADLPELGRALAQGVLTALAVVAAVWLALRAIDSSTRAALSEMDAEKKRSMTSVLELGRRAGRIFVIAIGALVLLANLGVNVNGLIAGLGVGGIAIALAAQKTVENIFGGISVVADRTVRVGDFCEFGAGRTGTIEKIGLRSTWIRTLDRTLISIPNADFSLRQIENYAPRDRIRLYTVLGLRYETTPDQMRDLLAALRHLLETHPLVRLDPGRVRFVKFGPSSLDVEISAYVMTSDFEEFTALREEIYLRMMDLVRQAGTSIAFPSQTLYLGRDSTPGRGGASSDEVEAEGSESR